MESMCDSGTASLTPARFLLRWPSAMSKLPSLTTPGSSGPIETLHSALDQTYRRLVEAAKDDWNRLFTDPDPSADCVSVKISKDQIAEELAGVPRSDFIPVKRQPSFNLTVRGPWRR